MLGEVVREAVDGDTHLSHRIALTHGYAAVLEGVEVDGDAVGRADFVLTTVSLADGCGRIEVASKVLGKFHVEFFRFFVELFLQGENSHFDGCDLMMQVEHHAGVVFSDLFFVVCVCEECEEHTIRTERRLDDVRHVLLVGDGVDITQILAACLDVLIEVIVRAVCNAPKFAPTEGEFILEVRRGFGVEAKFFLVVVAEFEIFVLHAEVEEPFVAEILPIRKPFEVGAGLAEEFKFHLLKFTDAEDKVAGSDLVAETLAYLTDAERHFFTSCALHVLEVDKDALSGFGAQIHSGSAVLGDADKGLEHKVELSHACKIAVAAHGAGDFMLGDILLHLLVGPARNALFDAVLCHILFDKIVGAMAGFARLAVHKRIGKTTDMSAGLPSGGVHNDCAVKTYVVGAFDDEFFPPSLFDVVFHCNTEGAVVPRIGKTAVNLAAGIYETAVFRKRDEFVHCYVCHNKNSFRTHPDDEPMFIVYK